MVNVECERMLVAFGGVAGGVFRCQRVNQELIVRHRVTAPPVQFGPQARHLSLVNHHSPAGERLAKREKAADVGFLRSLCPEPEPLVGYLAWLLGQIDHYEPLKAADLIPLFDAKKIPRHDITVPGNYWENLTRNPTASSGGVYYNTVIP